MKVTGTKSSKQKSLERLLEYKQKRKQAEENIQKQLDELEERRTSTLEEVIAKTTKNGSKVWTPDYLVVAFECATSGLSLSDTAEVMGIPLMRLHRWMKRYPELKRAVKYGNSNREKRDKESLSEFIYNELPSECRLLWDKLLNIADSENFSPGIDVENLLRDKGKVMRQRLFLQALVSFNFDHSRALRFVNLSKQTFDKWMNTDDDFKRLVNEINWHRQNFVENALMDLVNARVPSAVMFASKAINKDRGYGNTLKVEHTGTVNHNHSIIAVEDLQLPLEVQKAILECYNQRKAKLAYQASEIGGTRTLSNVEYVESELGSRDEDGFIIPVESKLVASELITEKEGEQNVSG